MVDWHWIDPIPREKGWRKQAKCNGQDPKQFHPDTEDNYQAVRYNKHYCDDCPVKKECLDFALANRAKDGLWGGTVPADRTKMFQYYKGEREYELDPERDLFPTIGQLASISMDDTPTAHISGNLFDLLADQRRFFTVWWEEPPPESSAG